MSDNSTKVFPFIPILTLIFITLKLTNYLSWSWWWVLSPIWIPLGIVAVIFAVIVIFLAVKSLIEVCNLWVEYTQLYPVDAWHHVMVVVDCLVNVVGMIANSMYGWLSTKCVKLAMNVYLVVIIMVILKNWMD